MAEQIVVALEVIDVDHQQGQLGAMAVRALHLFGQPQVEAAAVGQAGQGVGGREIFEPCVGLLQRRRSGFEILSRAHHLGHVGAHAGHATAARAPLVDAQPTVAGQLLQQRHAVGFAVAAQALGQPGLALASVLPACGYWPRSKP